MLYQTNRDLPLLIQQQLSEALQELYRAAFNSALHWYGEEPQAHRAAWRAVRSQIASSTSTINGHKATRLNFFDPTDCLSQT